VASFGSIYCNATRGGHDPGQAPPLSGNSRVSDPIWRMEVAGSNETVVQRRPVWHRFGVDGRARCVAVGDDGSGR